MKSLTKILKDAPKNLRDGFLVMGDCFPWTIEVIQRYKAKKEEIHPKDTSELITIGEKAFSRFVNRWKEVYEKESPYEKVVYAIPYCIGCGGGAITFPISWPVCATIDGFNYRKHKKI
ncbi:hypothetical protein AYK26_06695 [Euryarchaeota archaeon SM23-78]|nr:MAG: hypothetical protein AYK26_06695 [Euryarchaeota archaeon SM23-78]MBW3001383.1 hypothetical protein [Candidatus Woesearchaeota archaeon]